MKITTIAVSFGIDGVSASDDIAYNRDPALRQKGLEIVDALDAASAQKPLKWGNPYPFHNRSEYFEAIVRMASALHVKVARAITPELSRLIPFPGDLLLRVGSDLFFSDAMFEGENALQPDSYEIRFASENKCTPCGDMCHICEGIVYSSFPAGSPFSPLIWVAPSGRATVNNNIKVQYRFVLEDA